MKQILITEGKELELLRKELEENQAVVLKVFNDHNHKEIPLVYGISILSTNASYFVKTEGNDLLKLLGELLSEKRIKISGHNLKDDYYALMANDLIRISNSEAADYLFETEFDTSIAQYLLDPSRSDYGLKSMMLEYYHEDIEDESSFLNDNGQIGFLSQTDQKYMDYGTKWCVSVEKLIGALSLKLTHEELDTVFYEVEIPLIEVLASMEAYGFAVDRKELMDAGVTIGEQINELSAKIYKLAGEEFNINSPLQLGVILFEKLGLPYGKKTKRGYATGVEVLDKLKDDYDIVNLILEYRMYF